MPGEKAKHASNDENYAGTQAILQSCKDFGESGESASTLAAHRQHSFNCCTVDLLDALKVVASLFAQAEHTKSAFEKIRSLSLLHNSNKAAQTCCAMACEHLNASYATVVPPSTTKPKRNQRRHSERQREGAAVELVKSDDNVALADENQNSNRILIPMPLSSHANPEGRERQSQWSILLEFEPHADIPLVPVQHVRAAAAGPWSSSKNQRSRKLSCYVPTKELVKQDQRR